VFKLSPLPYAYDALAPTISAVTMRLHHDKHHAKYVETTNTLLQTEGMAPASLEEVVIGARKAKQTKLYNNAAQAWNHAFFWSCMTIEHGAPQGELADLIERAFGGLDSLKAEFLKQGEDHFGSGWVWLAATPEGLTVRTTHDGEDLLGNDKITPLLTCDLWEHAYYLDYRNDRKAFLEAWFDVLPDWAFAGHQLEAARGRGEPWRYPAPTAEPARRHAS